MNIPTHVAIIMDGNGRWAQQKGLLRDEGHKEGLKTAERIINHSILRGIKFLSLFVFSTENWSRPRAEIASLFGLAQKYISRLAEFCRNRIRVVVSGDKNGLPQNLVERIAKTEQITSANDAICVNLCINYGGRKDIVQSVNSLVNQGMEVTEQTIAAHLYNSFVPEPDLLIRTGGQKRLSNFLLFQCAYSEIYFSDTLWPNFSEKEYDLILEDFSKRTRTFGGI